MGFFFFFYKNVLKKTQVSGLQRWPNLPAVPQNDPEDKQTQGVWLRQVRTSLIGMTTAFHNICLFATHNQLSEAITRTPLLTSSHMLKQAISQGVNLAEENRGRNTHSGTICHYSPTLLFKLASLFEIPLCGKTGPK